MDAARAIYCGASVLLVCSACTRRQDVATQKRPIKAHIFTYLSILWPSSLRVRRSFERARCLVACCVCASAPCVGEGGFRAGRRKDWRPRCPRTILPFSLFVDGGGGGRFFSISAHSSSGSRLCGRIGRSSTYFSSGGGGAGGFYNRIEDSFPQTHAFSPRLSQNDMVARLRRCSWLCREL